VIKDGLKITKAFQVTLSLKDPETKKREIRGLTEAMNSYDLEEGTIITEEESDTISIDGKTIHVISAADWLCTIHNQQRVL